MLQKIISLLDKIEGTPLFKILSNCDVNSILKVAGFQLSSGVGRLKLSSFKAGEVRALLTALENRDPVYLKQSALCRSLYALLTVEDLKILSGRTDVLPELSGPLVDLLPFETMLECLDLVLPSADKLVKIGE